MKLSLILLKSSERDDQVVLAALREKIPDLSRAQLKRWLKDDVVRVRHRGTQLLVEVDIARTESAITGATHSFLPVIYESGDILVLHKTDGIPSAPIEPTETITAVHSALAHQPSLSRVVGMSPREPALLHRLDTRTSGCLAFAKSQAAFDRLRAEWKSGGVRKTYRAIVLPEGGAFDASRLPTLIDTPLAHDAKSAKRMLAVPEGAPHSVLSRVRGKQLEARTRILAARELGQGRWDLTLEIETGVMHQIRCHLASIGLPIEGDRIYGRQPRQSETETPRMGLHAWKLEFPSTHGSRVVVESLLPWDKA
jgi:23S rRNA pseudouridine1911/1915/1917 synthase